MSIDGWVADGYEPVADEFQRNFDERRDLGAAFAAVADGRVVADLWGGIADPATGAPWREDTLQLVFSSTKGFVAICLLILIERGRIDLDAPVSQYWPEFAAAGKADTLVGHLVSHQAGLPGIRQPLELVDLLNGVRMAELLAAQEPFWPPGSTVCYHPETWGWLNAELIRRVDGRTVGTFFAEEVAQPLDLEIWIGLPAAEEHRVTMLRYPSPVPDPPAACVDDIVAAMDNPPVFSDPLMHFFNSSSAHAAEIPASNGIGTARSIARLYGCLALGGEIEGVRLLKPETIELGRTSIVIGPDPCYPEAIHNFGVGFQVQAGPGPYGPVDAFGHGGAGGSVNGVWPAERIGLSYIMNELRDDKNRTDGLFAALHRAHAGLARNS